MKSIIAASAASMALVAGAFVGASTAPATAVARDDGAHHARHTGRDDGARSLSVVKVKRADAARSLRVAKVKRDDGARQARHTGRDDGRRAKRDDGPHRDGRRHG